MSAPFALVYPARQADTSIVADASIPAPSLSPAPATPPKPRNDYFFVLADDPNRMTPLHLAQLQGLLHLGTVKPWTKVVNESSGEVGSLDQFMDTSAYSQGNSYGDANPKSIELQRMQRAQQTVAVVLILCIVGTLGLYFHLSGDLIFALKATAFNTGGLLDIMVAVCLWQGAEMGNKWRIRILIRAAIGILATLPLLAALWMGDSFFTKFFASVGLSKTAILLEVGAALFYNAGLFMLFSNTEEDVDRTVLASRLVTLALLIWIGVSGYWYYSGELQEVVRRSMEYVVPADGGFDQLLNLQ